VRIIAGEFRGRSILPPTGDTTRPITDRAKQSIFDVLSPLIPDAIVFDCFSGTGSMGLECLSRGATRAYFFDADRSAIKRLKENIDSLRAGERSKIVAGDIFKLLTSIKEKPDLIFLDPPYRFLVEKPDPLQRLAGDLASACAAGATLVFRHDTKDKLSLPGWSAVDVRTYGSMTIELLRSDG
jgi:16S rRNA (guanine(966)-N(2))-methyltransferase RsmD